MINPYLTEKAGLLYGHLLNNLPSGKLVLHRGDLPGTFKFRWFFILNEGEKKDKHLFAQNHLVSDEEIMQVIDFESFASVIAGTLQSNMAVAISKFEIERQEKVKPDPRMEKFG